MAEQLDFRNTASLGPSSEPFFHWEHENSNVPYHLQGNTQFETAAMRNMRMRIKYHPMIREAINRFWQIVKKNELARVDKEEYTKLCLRISKLLLPDFNREEAINVVDQDWENDSEGTGSLDYNLFYNAMYELADMWTDIIDPQHYADFLKKVFRRITTKKQLRRTGAVNKQLPNIKLVFPEEITHEEHWEQASDADSYDSEYEYQTVSDPNTGQESKLKKLKEDPAIPDINQIAYDEVIESDWEDVNEMYQLELADLDDVIPFGQVAQEYINKLKRGQEFEGSPEIEEVEEVSQQSPPSTARISFVEKVGEHLTHRGVKPIDAFDSLDIKNKINLVISEDTKNKLQESFNSKAEVNLVRTTAIKDKQKRFTGKDVNSKSNSIHQMQINFLEAEAEGEKQTPGLFTQTVSPAKKIENASGWSQIASIYQIRKNLLDQKYAPIARRETKRLTNLAKRGLQVPVQQQRSNLSEDDNEILPSVQHLISSELVLRFDPNSTNKEIINDASFPSTKVLLLGKPTSGKTSLAKRIAEELDLVHINLQTIIQKLLNRHKAALEELEEAEEDEPPPQRLTDFEQEVIQSLYNGQSLTTEQNHELINQALQKEEVAAKGYIMDIPLLSDNIPLIQSLPFNVVVDMEMNDADVLQQIYGIQLDAVQNKLLTQWDIRELTKPKPKLEDDEEEEEEEDAQPKVNFESLIRRPEDESEYFKQNLDEYNKIIRPQFDVTVDELPTTRRILFNAAGLSVEKRLDIVLAHLRDLKEKHPRARALEPENDFKALLFQDLEDDQEPRSWSLWGTIDPVALQKGTVVQGSPEYGAEYAGKVFVFENEKNQEQFISNPRRYLIYEPQMPSQYRIAIIGPAKSGKRTQAEYLSSRYGWRLIDSLDLINQSVNQQRSNLGDPQPSHPDSGLVQASAPEFEQMLAGELFPSHTLTPVILHQMGVPLMKRPPPPPTPKSEEEVQEEEQQDEAQEASGEEGQEGQEEDDENREDTEENEKVDEPIVYDDLPLTDIIAAKDEQGIPPAILGFIMIGFPYTEEDAQNLKDNYVEFDKILYFTDPTEGEILRQRGVEQLVNIVQDIENTEKAVQAAKEIYGEDIVEEVSIEGTEQEVHERIIRILDPFIKKIEDESIAITKEDLGEDRLTMQFGEYGSHDPIVYTKDNWLMPGSEELELGAYERIYRFAGETEMDEFKNRPQDYIVDRPIRIPPPHVMLIGIRGAGVKTQIGLLSDKFQLPVRNLRDEFVENIQQTRRDRLKKRILRAGFKAPDAFEDDEDEYNIELPDPAEDPEVIDEAEDFDRDKHEYETMRKLLKGSEPAVINGNWYDVDEETVGQGLVDILFEGRRLPEVVILLQVDEAQMLTREFDERTIKMKYEELMEERRREKAEAKERERQERIEAGEEIEEEEVEEDDEDDPDAPDLQAMLDEARQELISRREQDIADMEALEEAFTQKGVKVIIIDANFSKERVSQNIEFELQPYFQERLNMVERQLPIFLSQKKAQELYARRKAYLSIYRFQSPVTPQILPSILQFPVLYRNRLYFPKNEPERQEFTSRPLKYTENVEATPWDLNLLPQIAVIGPPRAGVSTLCRDLSNRLGIVRITLPEVLQEIVGLENQLASEILEVLQSGDSLSDQLKAEAVAWRLSQADCEKQGWVLDNYPQTPSDAMFLSQKGFLPHPVFYVNLDQTEVMKRCKHGKFTHRPQILRERYRVSFNRNMELVSWLQHTYDNIRYVYSEHSKWWVRDTALDHINQCFSAKRDYSIAQIKKQAVCIKNLPITRSEINQRAGIFYRYCPVAWKFKKQLEDVKHNEFVVEHNRKFYFFSSKEYMDAFIKNPDLFVNQRGLPKDLPRKLSAAECGQTPADKIELKTYCAVTLYETGELEQGVPTLLASYKGKVYTFKDHASLQKFMRTPWLYEKTQLPVKMPPKPGRVTFDMLSEFENSIGFLEQSLGDAVIKALLEVGTCRLVYPTLSVTETALKHFSILLKYLNPGNTPYLREKYRKRLQDFKDHCKVEDWLLDHYQEDEWVDWEKKRFLAHGEAYDELISKIMHGGADYFLKFIR